MPIGPYEDFEECVADNQDKDDPEAFCAALEEQEQEGRIQAAHDRVHSDR